MNEASKALQRRLRDPAFHTCYFAGHGLDVGAGNDGLSYHHSLFPLCIDVTDWDKADGDAMTLDTIAGDNVYDFVHSSHCLEHLTDPLCALWNWLRVIKPGGHVIVLVPDEDLYEQGVWPSTFNSDHKVTFTIWKAPGVSWSPVSVNVLDLVRELPHAELVKVERLESTFLTLPTRDDQTLGVGESAIEFVLRKRVPE